MSSCNLKLNEIFSYRILNLGYALTGQLPKLIQDQKDNYQIYFKSISKTLGL